jgi:hypothetical protein
VNPPAGAAKRRGAGSESTNPEPKVVNAQFMMPGRRGAVNPLFDLDPGKLSLEMLLRLHFWHQATTAQERARWLPYTKGSILKSFVRGLAASRQAVQREINRRLLQICEGCDPRTVFKFGPQKKRGEHLDPSRNQAMTMEVLRLVQTCGLGEKEACEPVGAFFSVDSEDVVRRALRKWRNDPRFSTECVRSYAESLPNLKLID